ncbi:MAG: histidine kinase [Acidobacteriota bacterium]
MADHRPSPRAPGRRLSLFWILQLGGWGLFGAGMFVAGLSVFPLFEDVCLKSSLTIFGFGASLLLRLIYRAEDRLQIPLAAQAAVAVPASFGAAAVWMAAHHLTIAAVLGPVKRGGGFRWDWREFPDFTNTIYYFFVLVAWSVLYYGVQATLDLSSERERLRKSEALGREARLHALQLQLSPHFLFNGLNAISTLVHEARNAEANRMLSRLSDFLRATLDRPITMEVPLDEEIELACRYLEIERIRFGDRLKLEISVSPDTRAALVPPLILQPLVENAVRHAILPREGGGCLSIRAARADGWLTLAVADDGPGMREGARTPGGVGLANTRERLAELYGGRAVLSFDASESGGLSVSIRIPFRVAVTGAA